MFCSFWISSCIQIKMIKANCLYCSMGHVLTVCIIQKLKSFLFLRLCLVKHTHIHISFFLFLRCYLLSEVRKHHNILQLLYCGFNRWSDEQLSLYPEFINQYVIVFFLHSAVSLISFLARFVCNTLFSLKTVCIIKRKIPDFYL